MNALQFDHVPTHDSIVDGVVDSLHSVHVLANVVHDGLCILICSYKIVPDLSNPIFLGDSPIQDAVIGCVLLQFNNFLHLAVELIGLLNDTPMLIL